MGRGKTYLSGVVEDGSLGRLDELSERLGGAVSALGEAKQM